MLLYHNLLLAVESKQFVVKFVTTQLTQKQETTAQPIPTLVSHVVIFTSTKWYLKNTNFNNSIEDATGLRSTKSCSKLRIVVQNATAH